MSETKGFDIEKAFEMYLKRVTPVSTPVPEVQRTEMRRAFVAGLTDMLVFMTQGPLIKLFEADGVERIDQMYEDLNNFWQAEAKGISQ